MRAVQFSIQSGHCEDKIEVECRAPARVFDVLAADDAARGRRGGRKPVVTADKLERAKALLAKGLTVREAANALQDRKVRALLYEALNLEPAVDARTAYIAIGNTKC